MQQINTVLLSYGMSGKVFHAPFLEQHEGFNLVGAWERSVKKIHIDFPDCISFTNLEAVLEANIDLVVVNTPVDTHYEYAKKSLLAGKHVLVEKSFTTTVSEAKQLKALAKEKGLKLAVFHNRRWDSDFKTVRKIISETVLGDIVEAEFHFDRYNPSLSPKLHKETTNPGAGILKDLGPHIIDQALCLFGMPNAVFADIRITRENSLVEDWFDITLFYQTFRVRLKAGFFVREPIPSYIIHGTKGSFLKSRGDIQEEVLKTGQKPNSSSWGQESPENQGILHTEIDGKILKQLIPTLQGNYLDFFEGMYHSITSSTIEPVTAQDGVNVMTIIQLSLESAIQKKIMELPKE
jgi:scyllo-inositol 2-dehydrogenase (NADP+)